MLAQNFNLIEGSLYRSPLRLMEGSPSGYWDHEKEDWVLNTPKSPATVAREKAEMAANTKAFYDNMRANETPEDKKRRAHDLGYHHAVRGHEQDPSASDNQEAYMAGFEAARGKHIPGLPPSLRRDLGGHSGMPRSRQHKSLIALRDAYGDDGLARTMRETGETAVKELKQSRPELQLGDELGCGKFGCVYRAPPLSDGTEAIMKIDRGLDEGVLAEAVMRDPVLSKLSSLPRFGSVTPLSTNDPVMKRGVTAIHRENLRDLNADDPQEKQLQAFFGNWYRPSGFGRHLNDILLYMRAKRGMGREDYLRGYDELIKEERQRAAKSFEPHVGEQFERVAADVRELVSRGVVPCDLHEDNWGIRHSTGEIVMRDVGCAKVADD
jgi:hypothetical protein